MEKLNLDELKIKLSDYTRTDLDGITFLEHWQQVTDISNKLGQNQLEISDPYKKLEEKSTKISEYSKRVKQTAEENGFRVLDAHVSRYSPEQKYEFAPAKVIICIPGTLEDIAQAGIKTAAELVEQRRAYDKAYPRVDIEVLDDYLSISVDHQEKRGRLTKLLTKSDENWLLDFQKQLQEMFNIQINLQARTPHETKDIDIAKKRKKIHDDLKNPEKQPFLELIYAQLAENTATHANFMKYILEDNRAQPNIYVADLREFLFVCSSLKDSVYFGSYVAFVSK